MRVYIYDGVPTGSGLESRIVHWLKREGWTLSEAAMMFCDIAPDLAEFDCNGHLTACITLTKEYHGASARLSKAYADILGGLDPVEFASSDDDDTGSDDIEEYERGDESPSRRSLRGVDLLDALLADVRGRLDAVTRAGTGVTFMSPVEWIQLAVRSRIAVPWLEWATATFGILPAHAVDREDGPIPWAFNEARVPKGEDQTAATGEMPGAQSTNVDVRSAAKRDEQLQQVAEDIAREWIASGRRHFSKRDVAKELASGPWNEMTATRIERVIRVTWDKFA